MIYISNLILWEFDVTVTGRGWYKLKSSNSSSSSSVPPRVPFSPVPHFFSSIWSFCHFQLSQRSLSLSHSLSTSLAIFTNERGSDRVFVSFSSKNSKSFLGFPFSLGFLRLTWNLSSSQASRILSPFFSFFLSMLFYVHVLFYSRQIVWEENCTLWHRNGIDNSLTLWYYHSAKCVTRYSRVLIWVFRVSYVPSASSAAERTIPGFATCYFGITFSFQIRIID